MIALCDRSIFISSIMVVWVYITTKCWVVYLFLYLLANICNLFLNFWYDCHSLLVKWNLDFFVCLQLSITSFHVSGGYTNLNLWKCLLKSFAYINYTVCFFVFLCCFCWVSWTFHGSWMSHSLQFFLILSVFPSIGWFFSCNAETSYLESNPFVYVA